MPAPKEILDLIERFQRNIDAYKTGQYNETQLRREFLDPFFKQLGWDIDNTAGYAEPYKDVIHEDQIRLAGAAKAPDYSFRIGGARKFFLEAKKPSIYIKGDPSPAFQLRRYAWTEKLPLSILSDFEEFAVYDGRFKPINGDDASKARVFYCTYEEYPEKWDWIASIFSRDAILKGSFDKYAEANKNKRGTTDVDDDFLATIENWRKELAQNLALRNPSLTQRELNFAVQRIIDRIIFLRICEDRAIEDYGRLRALTNGDRIYPRLCELFEDADVRYNSGLFHFKKEKDRHEAPDELTLQLQIDDKLLRDILKPLYYPDCPYAFSHFPADILGQVYEQFLGKVIELTEGHRAKVVDKPEVKKAGGVYYTPTYIVKYIVEQTVGKLLENKTPKQAANLRILDPACGSGSFLIGAYQHLLDWHLNWYTQNDPVKYAKGSKPALVQAAGGVWKLTIDERKRILLNNIYGVDIDSQAVETTKLSLLLKVLEGETNQSLQPVLKIFHERALPDLGDNIKCGNSIIGTDFYEQPDLPRLTDEDRYRINVFDWHTEFPQVFQRKSKAALLQDAVAPLDFNMPGVPLHGSFSYKQKKSAKAAATVRPEVQWEGGFDAVIGNPPYVRQELLSKYKNYFAKHYAAFDSSADLYTYFMEKGVQLLRPGGYFSIIVSSSFLRATFGGGLRSALRKNSRVVSIVDFGGIPIFENAKDTYVCIPLILKSPGTQPVLVHKVQALMPEKAVGSAFGDRFEIPAEQLTSEAWSLASPREMALFRNITRVATPLGRYIGGKMFYGLKSGLNEAFEIDAADLRSFEKSDLSLIHPLVGGQEIGRYEIKGDIRYFIVLQAGWTKAQMSAEGAKEFSERTAAQWLNTRHPSIHRHLARFETGLRKRDDQGDYWWEFRPCDYYEVFSRPKIIFPDICKGPRFHLDATGLYLTNTAYCLDTADRYLLGVLNSKVFWFSIANISIPFGVRAGKFRYRLIYQYMEKVPIREIHSKEDKSRSERIGTLVTESLDLHKKIASLRTPQERTSLERQIAATDAQIDRLVYELYGLTEDEIKIIEQATA